MNSPRLLDLQYKSFVSTLNQSTLDPSKPYVKKDRYLYITSHAKDHFFRTRQITSLSQECLSFFSSSTNSQPLKERIELLTTLKDSLSTCSSRIENSIKRRWWYNLLHCFGYQAKCPAGIQNLLQELETTIGRLQSEQMTQEQEAKRNKKKPPKLDLPPQKSQDDQPPQNPLSKQTSDLQGNNPQSSQTDPIKFAIDAFDFAKLDNDIKTSIYNFLSCTELAKMREVSSSLKKSIDDYLAQPKLLFKLMIELVELYLKNNYHQAQAPLDKYQLCLDLILQYTNLEITFQQDADFKVSLLDHLTLTPEVLIWNKDSNSIKNLIEFFFKYASGSQWTAFIRSSLTNLASTLSQPIYYQQYKDKYHACLDHILQYPKLKELLKQHAPFKEAFFEHFLSQRPDIDWNQKSEEYQKNVIDLFFDYATGEQLTSFINNDICHLTQTSRWGQAFIPSFPDFMHFFLKNLTSERIDRLVKIPNTESFILLICDQVYLSHSIIYTSPIRSLHQQLPHTPIWNQVKEGSQFLNLRSLVITLEIIDLIKEPFNPFFDDETLIEGLMDRIQALLSHFKHGRSDSEVTETLEYILSYLEDIKESLTEAKLIALTRAFTLHPNHGAYLFRSFVREILQKDSNLFTPILKEFIKLNCTLPHPEDGLDIFEGFTKKEHVEIFIQACKDMPEPMKTFHLRALAGSVHSSNGSGILTFKKSPFKEVELVFKEAGLEFSHYPAVNRIFFWQTPSDLKHLANLQSIDTAEKLKNKLLAPKTHNSKNRLGVLSSLAAGVELTPGNILKTALDQETTKKAFEQSGFSFEFFNKLVTLDDFFKEDEDSTSKPSEKLEE